MQDIRQKIFCLQTIRNNKRKNNLSTIWKCQECQKIASFNLKKVVKDTAYHGRENFGIFEEEMKYTILGEKYWNFGYISKYKNKNM